jgi:hypothetical protein
MGLELSFEDQLSLFGRNRRKSQKDQWSLQRRRLPPPPPQGYGHLQELQHHAVHNLQQLFNLFDEDISGTITDAELEVGLCKMGHELGPEQYAHLISTIDQDHPAEGQRKDGVIDFEEFSNALLTGPRAPLFSLLYGKKLENLPALAPSPGMCEPKTMLIIHIKTKHKRVFLDVHHKVV